MPQITPVQPSAPLNYESPFGNHPGDVWVKGNQLHLRDGTILPAICISCGGADRLKSRRRALAWTPSWMYVLLIFPGLLFGGIIILLNQKKATVTTSSCADCRRKFLINALIATAALLGGIASLVLAATVRTGGAAFGLAGLILIIGSLIFALVKCRQFSVARIDPPFAILKGIHPEFLKNVAR